MNGGKIFLIFLFLLFLGGVIIGGYLIIKNINKDNNVDKTVYNTFFIECKESVNKTLIDSNFTLYLNNSNIPYLVGKCDKYGYKQYKAPADAVYNFVSGSPGYYTSNHLIAAPQDNMTYDIYLYKAGDFIVNTSDKFNQKQGVMNLEVSSTGFIQGLNYCIIWGMNTLDVNSNHESINVPIRLKNRVNKCYNTLSNLDSNEIINITLDYRNYDIPNSQDYIKIYLIDSDLNLNNSYVIENSSGSDIALNDYIFYVKTNETSCLYQGDVCGI